MLIVIIVIKPLVSTMTIMMFTLRTVLLCLQDKLLAR